MESATAKHTTSSPLATQRLEYRSTVLSRLATGIETMSRIRTALICVIAAVVSLLVSPLGNATPVLSFNQVDFFQDGALVIPNSEWGEFDIAYDQGSSLQWVNIVANPGTPDARWIVQNHPLLPTGLTGTSQFTSVSYFDLGTPRGTSVSSLNVGYAITSAPASGAPTMFDATGLFSLGSTQNIINSGVPSGVTTQGAPDNGNLNWNVPFTGLTADWHVDMPNVTQEKNWCGPGAATNSLHWLNDQNNLGLTQTLLQTQTELAANMMNKNNGNWDDKELQGKEQFVSDHKLPVDVHYAGGATLPNKTPLTWDWIESQMAQGQDVEFMTDTHWVVVEGLLSWDNIHLFSYRDDPYQHGAATTAAEQGVIDDRHVWTYFQNGFVDIGNGREILQAAVAESVPEPPTILLWGIGLVFLLGTHWERHQAGKGDRNN
ncbi:MAG: hypothetical protein ACREPZ_01515 [Rhodanobacteraceae bacterium]